VVTNHSASAHGGTEIGGRSRQEESVTLTWAWLAKPATASRMIERVRGLAGVGRGWGNHEGQVLVATEKGRRDGALDRRERERLLACDNPKSKRNDR